MTFTTSIYFTSRPDNHLRPHPRLGPTAPVDVARKQLLIPVPIPPEEGKDRWLHNLSSTGFLIHSPLCPWGCRLRLSPHRGTATSERTSEPFSIRPHNHYPQRAWRLPPPSILHRDLTTIYTRIHTLVQQFHLELHVGGYWCIPPGEEKITYDRLAIVPSVGHMLQLWWLQLWIRCKKI